MNLHEHSAGLALPQTSVRFSTADPKLQSLYDAAEQKETQNIVQFSPTMKILVEGAQYHNCWIETQPMGGEMYAKRNLPVALNNQLIFLLTQRPDGRLPGMITSTARTSDSVRQSKPDAEQTWNTGTTWWPKLQVSASYGWFQGFCFPEHAWRMYFWIGRDKAYLQKLYEVLAAHDAYLWRTRDSDGDGMLESWCTWDTAEDMSNRYGTRNAPTTWPFETPPGSANTPDPQNAEEFKKYWPEHAWKGLTAFSREQVLVPFASMDVMAYSYDARATLAKISRELGNGKEVFWQQQAAEVRERVAARLWNRDRHACFDRDRTGKPLDELIHNNIRAMYHGVFSQQMADEFIEHHLLNPDEFWTPFPLPSIAINEPLFQNDVENNWSGQPQGLTYQRAIRALENYGHYAILTRLGQKLIEAVERGGNRFTQQFDPRTGLPSSPKQDGYGPTMLAVLEYISRMYGVHLDLAAGRVWWSACDAKEFTYAQHCDDREWSLTAANGRMTAKRNGRELFNCTAGARVVTDLEGKVLEVVGIAPDPRSIVLDIAREHHELTVSPNRVIPVPPPAG